MENPASFDLDESIRRWRRDFESSPALNGPDIEELEIHLLDSMAALQARGLTPAEAFAVAARRIGQGPELAREFGKVNVRRLWIDRAVWMVVGVLAFFVLGWFASSVAGVLVQVALSIPLHPHWAGLLFAGGHGAATIGAMALFWIYCTRGGERLERITHQCVRRPLLPVIGLIALSYGWKPFWMWSMSLGSSRTPLPFDTAELSSILNAWSSWSCWVNTFGLIALFVWLARRCWMDSDAPIAPQIRLVDDLPSSQRERSRTLMNRGLSLDEAVLLITRPGNSDTLSISSIPTKSLWMERAAWMLAGILGYQTFFGSLFMSMQGVTLAIAEQWPFNGHWLGLAAAGAQLAAAAGLMMVLWKAATGCPKWVSRMVQSGLRRPWLGILQVTAVFFGIGIILRGFLAWTARVGVADIMQAPSATTMLALRWTSQGQEFIHNVGLVLLLFWLARRVSKAGSPRELNDRRCAIFGGMA